MFSRQALLMNSACLNSDHKAVKATVINGASERRPQSGRILPTQTWKPSADFAKRVDQAVDQLRPSNIPELEKVLRQEVQQGECEKVPEQNTFFHFPENVERLRAQRRACSDPLIRKSLSKTIQKEVRKQLRAAKATKIQTKLQQFSGLSDLHAVHRLPVTQTKSKKNVPVEMNALMEKLFFSEVAPPEHSTIHVQGIPLISWDEFQYALGRLSRGKY